MKLLFSEYHSDYANYIFPYAIWAIPENEAANDIFAKGFLPSSRNLDLFYLCRQIRIRLDEFNPSSENRRIIRKGTGIDCHVIQVSDFDWNDRWRQFCKKYADKKFGPDVMSYKRLDDLFKAPIVNHIMLFKDTIENKDVGLVMMFLISDMAYYYYSFYNLDYFKRNLGMYMMTRAVTEMKEKFKCKYLYLGTCYSRNALYKTQFHGAEFFNGFRWSDNLEELKYLVRKDQTQMNHHLLEDEEYIDKYYQGDFSQIINDSGFQNYPK